MNIILSFLGSFSFSGNQKAGFQLLNWKQRLDDLCRVTDFSIVFTRSVT